MLPQPTLQQRHYVYVIRRVFRHLFNDLERPVTKISRSRHHLTLNISETVRDADIITQGYHFEWCSLTLSEIFNDAKYRAVSLRQLSFLLGCLVTKGYRHSYHILILINMNDEGQDPQKIIIEPPCKESFQGIHPCSFSLLSIWCTGGWR